MNPYYRDYADFLAEVFGPGKVQKLSVDAEFTCPNRDGTLGLGGCAYCNNRAFSPDYKKRLSPVAEQIAAGKRFFARKYPRMRYAAYFQSYTSTYGDIDTVTRLYEEAAAQPDVIGLIIGTRPDCMPDRLLERLAQMNRRLPVIVEYGAESSHDTTLARVNRCHTWAQTVNTANRTADAGLHVGLHLIMGLPGETEEMMLATVDRLNTLPISTVKFHQLQIIKGTRLAAEAETPATFTIDDYISLCTKIVRRLRPDIAIERFISQAPPELLIAPRWGIKNYQFTHRLLAELKARPNL